MVMSLALFSACNIVTFVFTHPFLLNLYVDGKYHLNYKGLLCRRNHIVRIRFGSNYCPLL